MIPGEDSANEGEAEGEDLSEEDGKMEQGQDGDLLPRVEAEESIEANEEQSGEIQLETLKWVEEKEKKVKELCGQKGEWETNEETKSDEESTDLCFPDTTILLTHLQSNR